MKKWTVISNEYLKKNRWLTVRQNHVKMPSGVEIRDDYVLEYPNWINVLAITDKGEFIVERQFCHGTMSVDYWKNDNPFYDLTKPEGDKAVVQIGVRSRMSLVGSQR